MDININNDKIIKRGRPPKNIFKNNSSEVVSFKQSFIISLNVTLNDVKDKVVLNKSVTNSFNIIQYYKTLSPTEIPSDLIAKQTVTVENTNDIKLKNNIDIMCEKLLDTYNNKWPNMSPYACWNCDMFFECPPVGIPDKEFLGKYYCYGNFCSFQCAYRYLYEKEFNTNSFYQKYSILCYLYQQSNNLSFDSVIIMSPAKETREKYGGNLSDNEYKKIIQENCGNTIEILKLPLVPIYFKINNNPINIQNETKIMPVIPLNKDYVNTARENVKKFILENSNTKNINKIS